MNTSNPFRADSRLRSTRGQITLILLTIVTVYLITEHTAHVLQLLPYALLLMCPLLHLFMHGSYTKHDEHSEVSRSAENRAHHEDTQ
jgi:hypothetical protein